MQIALTKRVCEGFEIKNLGKYHNLYVKNHILLPDVDLRTFGICALEYMSSTLFVFSMQQG